MRFKVDENLPPEVVSLLSDTGHDAHSVWDEALNGKPDALVAEACQRGNRALLTLDLGFADIRTYPPEDFAGLIVLRLQNQSRAHVVSVCTRLLPLLAASEVLEGYLLIVDEFGVRIRGPE